jgi:Fe-S-cluster containining protein
LSDTPCLRCGACCHQRPGTILVTQEDIAVWRRDGLDHLIDSLTDGHFGEMAFAIGPNGACIHLGLPGAPNDCSIHAHRASVCRSFRPGSPQCQEFIRDRERAERRNTFMEAIAPVESWELHPAGWAMGYGVDCLRRAWCLEAVSSSFLPRGVR